MGGSDDHHNMIAGYKKMATSKSGKPAHNRGTSGPKASKETKMRMSSNRIGRKWFHDSNGTYFLRPDGCVSHLKVGRGPSFRNQYTAQGMAEVVASYM